MNKDIDEIFSENMENKIKKDIRKKRNKLNIKLVLISISSTLIIIIGAIVALNFASTKYIESSYEKDNEEKRLEYSIMHPDEYIGKESYFQTGYFEFQSTYEYGRRIGNKTIYAGLDSYLGGISKNGLTSKGWSINNNKISDDFIMRYTDVYGLRNIIFFYPNVRYGKDISVFGYTENNNLNDENIINDFHFLTDVDNNKIVEMSLSFDKEYIYEDINKAIDSKLITFYWVNNNSEEQNNSIKNHQQISYDIVGIKSIYSGGEFQDGVNGRRENFKNSIRRLKELGDTQYIENIDENNFKISGIVVVGSPKELISIENNPMIKHGVIANIVDKY